MGHRLLIVDSDQAFLKMHRVALDSAFDLDLLSGTEGALQRLEAGDYAAVLICVEASENKGYALCSAIRKHSLLQSLKIALISAKATEEEYARHQSLRGRADAYLHKPILSSALVAALGTLLPARSEESDNPLGDLAGVDLGEEWLRGLEAELDVTPLPEVVTPSEPFAALEALPEEEDGLELEALSQPPEAPPTLQTIALPILPMPKAAPSAGMVELLEARIKDLEDKLVDGAAALAARGEAVSMLESRLGQAEREAETLRDRLEEVEAHSATLPGIVSQAHELRREADVLKDRLEEAMEGRSVAELRLAEASTALEAARQNLTELEDRAVRAEAALSEVQSVSGTDANHVAEVERELELSRQDVTGLEATLRAQRRELAEQGTLLNVIRHEKEALEARLPGLEASQTRLTEVLAEAESLRSHSTGLETRLADLERDQEQALQDLRADHAQALASLREEKDQALAEAQAGREQAVATLQVERDETVNGLRSERDRLEAALQRSEAEAEATQGHVRELEEKLAFAERERDDVRHVADELRGACDAEHQRASNLETELRGAREDFEQRATATAATHQKELLELLGGVDEKEAQIQRMNQTLNAQRERMGTLDQERTRIEADYKDLTQRLREREEATLNLEQERRRLEGDLSERTARLEALTQAIADLEQGIRRASDLTRPF